MQLDRRLFILRSTLLTCSLPWAVKADTSLPVTPSCDDPATATSSQTAGPFYRANSPQRETLLESGEGTPFHLYCEVVDTRCNLLEDVVIEVWHADAAGRYDNRGYRYRGWQKTPSRGLVRFATLRPGIYPGRTPHFHVRLWQQDRLLLTTQLYFPDAGDRNRRDFLFDPSLQMLLKKQGKEELGFYRFIVPAS